MSLPWRQRSEDRSDVDDLHIEFSLNRLTALEQPACLGEKEPAMPNSILINATDIDQWAQRRESQEKLPLLVRRLIRGTATGLTRLEFAAEEGVQLGGWDGISVGGTSSTFVPNGTAGWELGVTSGVKGKADDDYDKRTSDAGELTVTESTFIFVTPRRWGGKANWVADKVSGPWRSIRAYDADDLETWLEEAPGVHIWASFLLGKRPEGAIDIATFWKEWASVTRYSLTSDLVIASRTDAKTKLLSWIGGAPSVLDLRAETIKEATAFYAATLAQLPETQREAFEGRSIVVETPEAFRLLALATQPLILIPVFEDRTNVPQAVAKGHHVLLPLGLDATGDDSQGVVLPRPQREAVRVALQEMRVPAPEVEELATLGRRGLSALRRRIALNPAVLNPAWATPTAARDLLPALLMGRWVDTNLNDRAVLQQLAAVRSYQEITTALTYWANQPDPFIHKVGDTWLVVSKEDSWRLLARFLTNDDLLQLEQVAVATLSQIDPQYELPPDQRWGTSVFGKAIPHSDHLREGIAETLALMAALGKTYPFQDGSDGEGWAQRIVSRIFPNLTDWQGWAGVCPVLPSLAEAAPDVFFGAVDGILRGTEPIAVELFRQESSFWGSSPHTGLLWALERLAWSNALLSRTAGQLATLARLDPGGKLGNRPGDSLNRIFLSWHPYTTAVLDQRLKVIDRLRQREPEVSWDLLKGILPSEQRTTHSTNTPEFRDWAPDPTPKITNAEILRTVDEIFGRLIADVGHSEERWRDLISLADDMPDSAFDAVVTGLQLLRPTLTENERESLRTALRELLSRHTAFPEAGWAMPQPRIDRLNALYTEFEPDDLLERHAWLFERHPKVLIPEGENWRERERMVNALRETAVVEIHKQGGLQRLLDLSSMVDDPWSLGFVVGRNGLLQPDDELRLLELALGSVENRLRNLGFGYIQGAVQRDEGWLEAIRSQKLVTQGTPAVQVDLLLSHDFDQTTWDLVGTSPEEVQAQYWQQVNYYGRGPLDGINHQFVVESMAAHGRVADAINYAAMYTRSTRSEIPGSTLAALLEKLLDPEVGTAVHVQNLRYEIPQILSLVEASGEVEETRIAQLEWGYLPLLEYSEYQPKVLHGALAKDPKFFCEIVTLVFRGKDEEPRELAPEDLLRARIAHELLQGWRQIPGEGTEGEIDRESLQSWLTQARECLEATGRLTIGEQQIGQLLARSPVGADGFWPHESIRDAIEDLESSELERGLTIGIFNDRGVTSRAPDEGGHQERALAARYRSYAENAQDDWPRLARLLTTIAEEYERDARREDLDAERQQDLWR